MSLSVIKYARRAYISSNRRHNTGIRRPNGVFHAAEGGMKYAFLTLVLVIPFLFICVWPYVDSHMLTRHFNQWPVYALVANQHNIKVTTLINNMDKGWVYSEQISNFWGQRKIKCFLSHWYQHTLDDLRSSRAANVGSLPNLPGTESRRYSAASKASF